MKKVILMLMVSMMVFTLVGCGKSEETKSSANKNATDTTKEAIIEDSKVDSVVEKNEDNTKEVLANWRGIEDKFITTIIEDDGSVKDVNIQIEYPSLVPASLGFTYQMDPALVLVTTPGTTKDLENIRVASLEDTFEVSKERIVKDIKKYRSYGYSDFDFIVESQEALTINNLETYKYTGKHTYTLDGESQEIPFVAYSFDTKQVDNIYLTVIVMDDSINNPSMEPLPEGTIEAYALKMIESVVVIDDIF